jgi:hypothetical protein
MKNTLRSILDTHSNIIDIDKLWPTLREKQYYNAMCELKQELELLASLPNIADTLKAKVDRSLIKITELVTKMTIKLN